ncbi:hypothetical protein AAG906_005379 [Vitis piasezkii]
MENPNIQSVGPMLHGFGFEYRMQVYVVGTVHIGSGWTNTKMSSSVHSTDPVDVLAPAPAPDISPAADAPTASDEAGSPRASSTPSSSYRIISVGVWSQLVLAISGGLVLFL